MKFTEPQLNAKNKTQLVELALELSTQLESAQSGPLKSSDVEKKLLDLARQATTVKDNAVKRHQEHAEELVKLQNAHLLATKKLELEYKSEDGAEATSLAALYKELEQKANLAKADLSFGLKQAEIDTQAEIDRLKENLAKIVEDYQLQIDQWKVRADAARTAATDEIAQISINHIRKVEQLRYDNGIAIRDENMKVAETIANGVGAVIIMKTNLEELKEFKATDQKDVATAVTTAVNAAKSEVYALEGAKLSALKSSTSTEIALLQKDKDYLTSDLANANTRITELSTQIKDFPSQLAKAVEAAKADITVQQDNKK